MIAPKSDGLQHATEKKLRIFQTAIVDYNVVYDMARLELLKHLVADLSYKKSGPARTKFQREQGMYCKKDEHGQVQQ